MHFALLMTALAAAPEPEHGCDVDSNAWALCVSPRLFFHATELQLLVRGVGSERELRQRLARVHAVSATVQDHDAYATVRFDTRGRFVQWVGPDESVNYQWDEQDNLLRAWGSKQNLYLSGGPTACSLDLASSTHVIERCAEDGARLVHTHSDRDPKVTVNDVYPLTATGFEPGANLHASRWRRDASGKVVEARGWFFAFSVNQTRATFKSSDTSEEDVWTLDAAGLPVRYRDSLGERTVTWKRSALVQVVDGACTTSKPCTNPDVDAIVAALAARQTELELVVERGAPPKNPRAATELWYQPGWQARADTLREVLKLPPERVREWTWGGPFDLLVIVGPARQGR